MKKTTVLTYAGLALCALGGWLFNLSDPDVVLIAPWPLIGGIILFVENLKLGIVDGVCERLTGQVDSGNLLTQQPVVAPHRADD